jgi:hypothetical protein
MNYDRRSILRQSLAGTALMVASAAAAQQAPSKEPTQNWSAPDADVPSLSLRSLVFQSKRLDATTEEYRKWYIEGHGPDYIAVAGPYLERYSRMFVEKAHMGPVDFDCVSELALRSREAGVQNMKALDSPEWKASLVRHPKPGKVPGPNEAHNGKHRFSVDERLLSGTPRGYDPPGLRKQVVLTRRTQDVDAEAYLHALWKFGSGIARDRKDAVSRLVLDMAVPDPKREAPMYDAVYLIWPAKDADLAPAFAKPPAGVEIVNVVDVVTYEPDLEAL